jgi:hypothetical protein
MEGGCRLNCVQKGLTRDKRILEAINNMKSMDTQQVATLFFRGLTPASAQRKAQQRLNHLYHAGLLKRSRASIHSPYVYYADKKSSQQEHLVATNWAYVWFASRLSSWETLWHWRHEYVCPSLRADAFCGIRNTVTGEVRFWFVELDRSENNWDKAVKYNNYFEKQEYISQWWVEYAKSFPRILAVTTSPARLQTIHEAIKANNPNKLKFEVRLLEDLQKECMTTKSVR